MSERNEVVPGLAAGKDGRATTVYKKQHSGTSQARVPSAVKPTVAAMKRKVLVDSIAHRFEFPSGKSVPQSLARTLESYPDELLERLNELRTGNDQMLWLIKLSVRDGALPGTVSEQILFYPELRHCNYSVVLHRIAALHCYDQIPFSHDLSAESDEVISQCRALLLVMNACNEAGLRNAFRPEEPKFTLRDERLVDLVVAYPDRAVEIASFIADRKLADVDLLTDLVHGKARSLGSGTL